MILQLINELPNKETECRKVRQSGAGRGETFFHEPVKEFKTGGAEIRFLKIGIFNPGGGVHDAVSISTMGQAQAMAQLVYRGLCRARD